MIRTFLLILLSCSACFSQSTILRGAWLQGATLNAGGAAAPACLLYTTIASDSGNTVAMADNGAREYNATSNSITTPITVCQLGFYIKKTGTPTQPLVAKIWSDTNNPNAVLGTSVSVSQSAVSTSISEVLFTFSTPVTLTPGMYWFGLYSPAADAVNYYSWSVGSFGAGSVMASFDTTAWASQGSSPGYCNIYINTFMDSPCGVLYCENFDNWTNWVYPASSPWNTNVNGWKLDYWTSGGAPLSTISNAQVSASLGLEGTACLQMSDYLGDAAHAISPAFAGQSECWVFWEMSCSVLQSSYTGLHTVDFLDASSNLVASVFIVTGGNIRVQHGTYNFASAGSITTGTPWYFWFHYKTGTGANGIADIGYSSTLSRPTSGSQYVQVTSGTATTPLTQIRLAGPYSGSPGSYYYDKIRVLSGATPPPDNPQ